MSTTPGNKTNNQSRILLHSQRNIFSDFHYRLGLYEFEDIIREVDSVDLIAPKPKNWFKYGTRIANRLAFSFDTAINPGIAKTKLKKDYDLFFAVVQFPKDLLHVKYIEGLKDHCKTSICWLNEMWITDIPKYPYFLKILAEFDYVFIQWTGTIEPLQKVINKQCVYLPYAINAIQFNPYPDAPQRVIDVYSIGRRSEITHRTLLKMAEENKIFYVYDTMTGYQVINPEEHRQLFANMAKRSRYFIVNPGKVEDTEEMAGQIEFGNRFFEGAASGTIMIGETPMNEKFKEVFSWPDAVIDMPYDSENIGKIIKELDKQPERQDNIRRTNVIQSLLNNDWVYRWESVLKTAGLDPMPALLERKERLRNLSKTVEMESSEKIK